MSKSPFLIHTVFFYIALFIVTSLANAQIRSLTVFVDGMACPFCAYGVEKKLKKVEGVKSIHISMKKGMATLSAKEGESINVSQVPKAVRDSGFTAGTIEIVAIGTINVDEKQRLFLQFKGLEQGILLIDLKNVIKERLQSHAKTGETLEIKGVIRKQSDDRWSLSPESVGEVSK